MLARAFRSFSINLTIPTPPHAVAMGKSMLCYIRYPYTTTWHVCSSTRKIKQMVPVLKEVCARLYIYALAAHIATSRNTPSATQQHSSTLSATIFQNRAIGSPQHQPLHRIVHCGQPALQRQCLGHSGDTRVPHCSTVLTASTTLRA
jgi:hypothetical protein